MAQDEVIRYKGRAALQVDVKIGAQIGKQMTNLHHRAVVQQRTLSRTESNAAGKEKRAEQLKRLALASEAMISGAEGVMEMMNGPGAAQVPPAARPDSAIRAPQLPSA